ncbi:uncharacterized protein LOC112514108 [Cynara cardunculus var. scolymus]|uniref:uncharacterized protein LOC112514108 n=1 Tax=Cynara cardunculus var. scolymus TaxID=59895 RepID=UPI000D6265DD|nr:uncharacterized protein LOC112514108 [Cynara cardunculus var. scolymus]
MSLRMKNRVNLAHGNSSQQVQEDTINIDSRHFIDDPVIDGSSHRRVRGPTYMPSIWAWEERDRIPVLFNEYGQPVDKETTNSLSHFMGSLARSGKYCPVDISWPQVSTTKKGMLLNFIETKFDLPLGSDDWILKSFAKKRLFAGCLLAICWLFAGYLLKISERNKTIRGYKKMMQIIGKKSYARVREELKESLSGREPSRMELFVACFSKDGIAKNVEAANAIVGDVVHLKSIINSIEIVARGRVKSLDPDELVGGKEISPNWCEVVHDGD